MKNARKSSLSEPTKKLNAESFSKKEEKYKKY